MLTERDRASFEQWELAIRKLVDLDVEPQFHESMLTSEGFIWELHQDFLDNNNKTVFPLQGNKEILVRFEVQPGMLGMITEVGPTGIKLAFILLKGGSTEVVTPASYDQSVPVYEPKGCLLEAINSLNRNKELEALWDRFLNRDDLTERQKEIMNKARNRLFDDLANNKELWIRVLKEDPLAAMNSWVSYGRVPNPSLN